MAQSHTPCNCCVRFATTVASGHATLATKQDATLYLGRTCTGWIAPAFPGDSFKNLVGACENGRRNIETKRLRCLEINDEIEFYRLLDREVCRLCAFENSPDVDARLGQR